MVMARPTDALDTAIRYVRHPELKHTQGFYQGGHNKGSIVIWKHISQLNLYLPLARVRKS